MKLTKSFNKLIENLQRLPGIGEKTAFRFALFIVNQLEKEEVTSLSDALIEAKQNISFCEICGAMKEDVCLICEDNRRDQTTIMVVETVKDLLVIENTNSYFGLYHVLGGTIDFSRGVEPEDLNIDGLIRRSKDDKEIILALNGAVDGQLTSTYIKELLKDKNVRLTKIAHGLPIGADLSFTDDKTLSVALENRTRIKKGNE